MNKNTSGRIVIGFVIAFVSLLKILHFLEPEFNFEGHLISEFELGQYGWMMRLAFWSLAGASLAIWFAIRGDLKTLGGRIGKWWLLLIVIAYIGAGLFIPDTSTGLGLPLDPANVDRGAVAPTLNATLHGFAGVIVIASSPIVFSLLSRSLAAKPGSMKSRAIRWATWLAWIGFLSLPISLTLYTVLQQPGGFDWRIVVSVLNRFMILTYAAWYAIVAWSKGGLAK
jgi:hypothetical protein